MAGGKFSDALLNGMTIRESANDGSDFSNPAADYRRLFLGEDAQLHVKDSAGAVTDIGSGGNVATDAIWDAAGDLAVGTGANTAARLAIGATNGMAVRRVSGAVAWAFPPGHELAYVENTSGDITITATTEGTGQEIVSAGAVTFDGSTRVCIEFYCPQTYSGGGNGLIFDLSDGGTEIGRMGMVFADGVDNRSAILLRRFLTPSAASHTYAIQAWKSGASTMEVSAGAGGTGASMPTYIRITVA